MTSPTPADSAECDACARWDHTACRGNCACCVTRTPADGDLDAIEYDDHMLSGNIDDNGVDHWYPETITRLIAELRSTRTAAPGPDADIAWSTSLGEPRGACCHCEHVAPGQVVVDREALEHIIAVAKEQTGIERTCTGCQDALAALSPDPSKETL